MCVAMILAWQKKEQFQVNEEEEKAFQNFKAVAKMFLQL